MISLRLRELVPCLERQTLALCFSVQWTYQRVLQVRRLDGVDCEKRPNWCRVLLQRVAPRVEWLSVQNARREHVDVIATMPALRYLRLMTEDAGMDAPDLPLQLEDLKVLNVPARHFESVQRMPGLRKLALLSLSPVNVAFSPLPPDHRGLQWLQVALLPASTALSLVTAHAATLQELQIMCASQGDTPWHSRDLAEDLRRCELAALRRVVLLRGGVPGFPDNKLPHGKESCRRQRHGVWDMLLAADSPRAARVVTVLCSECDRCPAFPGLGDFAWKDD